MFQIVKSKNIWNILKQVITGPLIQFGGQHFMLCKGLPQGGYLSAILCDIYYSHMDLEHLKEFQNYEDLFLRAVDDYLLVTSSKYLGLR